MSHRAVIVTGFPDSANLQRLRDYFLGKGADVEKNCLVRCSPESKVCVRFVSKDVCQGVLFHPNHECFLDGNRQVALHIQPCPADAEESFLPPYIPQASSGFVFGSKSLSPVSADPPGRLARWASGSALDSTASRKVLVRGLNRNTSRDTLLLFFENEGRCGGGDVREVKELGSGTALVEFEQAEVAARVVQRERVQFGNTLLRVTSYEGDTAESPPTTVLVRGFGPDTNQEILSLFFENSKRTGGGDVKEITINRDTNTAYVTFAEATVAERVSKRQDLNLSGCSLQVELHHAEQQHQMRPLPPSLSVPEHRRRSDIEVSPHHLRRRSAPDVGESCAVVAEGPRGDLNVHEQAVRLYFGNKSRSSGGDVRHIYKDPVTGRYIVTFAHHEVASRVANRRHSLGTSTLTVTSLPAQARDIPLTSGEQDPKRVCLKRLPPDLDSTMLMDYLREGTGLMPEDWTYGLDSSTCLVEFEKRIDFVRLLRHVRQFPLCGVMMGLERVARTCQLQVHNIDHVTDNALELYFESPNSRCGQDAKVDIYRDHHHAIITCSTPEAAAQASVRAHILSEHRLQVALYYPFLGVLPPDMDTKSPFRLPSPFQVSGQDPAILKFIKQSNEAKTEFDMLVEEADARFEWTESAGDVGILLHCTLQPDDPAARGKTPNWQQKVESTVYTFMDQFWSEDIGCSQDVATTVTSFLAKQQFNSDEISFTQTSDGVTLAGVREKVTVISQQAHDVKEEAEKKHEREHNTTEETINLPKHKLKALSTQHFIQIAQLDFPHVEIFISVEKETITFRGLRQEIGSTKMTMYETLQNMKERVSYLPSLKAQLLNSEKTVKFLESKLEEDYTQAVWETDGRSLIVYAPTSGDLDKAYKVLEDNLECLAISAPSGALSSLDKEEFEKIASQLEKQEDCPVLVEHDPKTSTVSIACLTSIVPTAREAVQGLIKAHSNIEESMTMSLPDECGKKLLNLLKSDITDIEGKLQKESVAVETTLHNDQLSFLIKGTPAGVAQAKESLSAMEGKIHSENIHITKPGMSYYFQSPAGLKALKDLEADNKVVIKTSIDDGSVDLTVIGISPQSVAIVMDSLHQHCDKESGVKVIGGPSTDPLSPVITKLEDAQKSKIMALEKKHPVLIQIRHSSIKLEGATSNLPDIANYITSFLNEWEEERKRDRQKEELKLTASPNGPKDGSPPSHTCALANGVQVQVFKSDITQFAASAIVSACDKELSCGGGVAKAIANAAGSTLKQNCKDYIRDTGNLQVANVVTTEAGNLSCSHVLHALGPRWDDYTDKDTCVELVKTTFSNVLTKADNDLGATSIVIPAISAGHVKVPKQSVAKALYEALLEYDQASAGKPSKISQVYLVNIDQGITDTIIQVFKDPNSVTKVPVSPPRASFSPPPSPISVTGAKLTNTLSNGLRVQVDQRDITTMSADVIVTPTGDNLCHDQGLASAIANVAGTELTSECKDYTQRHGNLKVGQVMASKGGGLKCKYVIHAYGPKWNDYSNKSDCCKELMQTYINCVKKAEEPNIKAKSIAIPGISTGVFHVPKDQAAKALYDALCKHDKNRTRTLQDVYIVDKDKDFISNVVTVFQAAGD